MLTDHPIVDVAVANLRAFNVHDSDEARELLERWVYYPRLSDGERTAICACFAGIDDDDLRGLHTFRLTDGTAHGFRVGTRWDDND